LAQISIFIYFGCSLEGLEPNFWTTFQNNKDVIKTDEALMKKRRSPLGLLLPKLLLINNFNNLEANLVLTQT